MNKELKPCPWCKKTPMLQHNYSRSRILHKCDVINVATGWGKKAEIIEIWNNGAEPEYNQIIKALCRRNRK